MNKFKGIPPIFYLNLDHRTDRKEHIENQFKKWDITDYTRWSASTYDVRSVDTWGRQLDQMLLAPSDASILMNEWHLLIEWYNSGISEYCVVVQDDLCLDLAEYWPFEWQDIMKALPYNWDIVQFYYCHDWKLSMHLHPRTWHSSSAACFMVNRFFVEKLMQLHVNPDGSIRTDQSLRDLEVPRESYSSDDFLLYQIAKSYTIPLLTLDPKLAVAQDNNQSSNTDVDNYNPVIAVYHNKIYDILSTTCTKQWWETQSSNFSAEDILSWGKPVHKQMTMLLPQYDKLG